MVSPFHFTPKVFTAISRIDQALGRLEGLSIAQPQPMLRKRNRVRSVQASAELEGNALSVDQVTALLDGKRVLGREQDVRAILNVNEAYGRLEQWTASSRKSLLAAHAVLLKGLVPNAGRFRTSGVGVFRGPHLTHLAPAAHLVDELFMWLRRAEVPLLVAGCVVHYELLSIHPFIDGNGRIARLWQQVIHREHSPLLQYVPVESIIGDGQRQYSATLRSADREGHCTGFLEFVLLALADALAEFGQEVRPARETTQTRLQKAHVHLGRRWFSRRDYLALHVKLSTATASRDLASGVGAHLLQARGNTRLAEYRFGQRKP